MKKAMKVLMPVLQGFVLCAMALQIILGVVYIGVNFLNVPQFRDTMIYLEMAEHFVADEYTGLLYPLFIKLCRSIPAVPFQIPIYILQIGLGIYCVYYFIHVWTERRVVSLICSLWINTIPFIAQAHVTVLPHSLAMSCLVLMLIQVLKGSIGRRPLTVLEWAELLCSYMILAQLTRDYMLAGTLFITWAAGLQFYGASKKAVLFMVSILVCVGMFVANAAIYHTTEQIGYYGRIQRSSSSLFFQRFGIETLEGKYLPYMPMEVFETFEDRELNMIGRYPYKVETEFGPVLEAKYGRERADEIYRELGLLGLSVATRDNVLAVAKDGLGYFIPMAVYRTSEGATSWNYQQFIKEAPIWSHAYANISHMLWSAGMLASMTVFAVLALYYKKLKCNVWLPAVLCMCLFAGVLTLNGAGAYDYKLALLPMILSYAPMSILVIRYIFNKG